MKEQEIREALNQLDGTPRSAVKLLTELTDEQFEALGGMADEQSGQEAPVPEVA